ncbi:D-2-hydroxyacid dehydrogenase family protein [Amycolatopsis cihanbeyliensis]|uniref:Lactate dehydrogenase-like 2-hydroxyacid dehydrogenase n=1 Tax=Amycolatopsis cihanbeyliensis TaxID=1128664 RepID=A0A542DDR5_AMYCI|nr:D-2-hydroxyacid dehydrogenase family protein [Amycolatopsis cihanbeyliensis]TQJ01218.1 lactate dehydrogenase-like 2-hydroxyacid dehydrogenase [Amycolatopsis cihanbeyliensis]
MKIAILDDYQNVALDFADWDSLGAEIEVFTEHIPDRDELVRRLAGVEAVVAMRERTPFPAELLDRLPELRLLVSTGRRNAAIDIAAARARGIVVCGTGYLPEPTAEHTWALILAAMRNLPSEERSMRGGGWQLGLGSGLHGRTLGLLGLGRLGSRVAAVGAAFGMDVIAWSQNLTAEHAAERGVSAVGREELFRRSDVLSIHLVLGDRTRGLVGPAELAAMKPTAWLVNTSRGPIVRERALLDALREGAIGGAALDVYDTEPLPAEHPLRTLPNTVLTPHIGYVTREVYQVFYADAVEDIAAYQAGAPIRVLDP